MTELDRTEMYHLLQRLPHIELSYETIPHTKVSPDYNICLGIPIGTKCYAWITFYGTDDVCFIMELNKDRKIARITYTYVTSGDIFANGTLFYGTKMNDTVFIIEDILMYKGISAKQSSMNEKFAFIYSFMKEFQQTSMAFYLPVIWSITKSEQYECIYDIPDEYEKSYPIHHIQYRCMKITAPYQNVFPSKKGFQKPAVVPEIVCHIPYRYANLNKPQYRQPTIFKVMADFQYDIYHLFAFGVNKVPVYYNIAYIPTYKSSVYMNELFRNIKENANIDAIEESDDEEDFENIEIDKYVDLKKSLFMECRFHTKFKKWVPHRVVSEREKVVHISQL